ncbi:MAG: flagellar basal body L-ring protein FlgH [Pseudomonadota bacterium]
MRKYIIYKLFVVMALVLSGCGMGDRLASVGKAPAFTPVANPVQQPDYHQVSLPMPRPRTQMNEANSLWQSGSRAFFRDQRARQVGDILTVLIDINDNANLQNSTTRNRTANSDASTIPSELGLDALGRAARKVLPGSDLTAIPEMNSGQATDGRGTIQRNERVRLQVAAVVSDVLPNGNFFIHGRQEVRVNFEVRDLEIAGVIRPEDITNTNTINLTQVAEARVTYGGRGLISNAQQPRIGQQIYDIIYPF